MAPPKDNTTPPDTHRDDPANPFIAFRRFADEQMSSVLHTFFGQPPKSKATESSGPDADLPWIAQAMTDEQRRRLRRLREEISSSEVYGMPTDPFSNRDEKEEYARGSEDESRRCPYRPANQEVPEENRSGAPPELAWKPFYDDGESAFPGSFGSWDEYLSFSKYSPLLLQQADGFKQGSPNWIHAFEDLIAVRDGRPLPPLDGPRPPSFVDRCTRAMDLGVLLGTTNPWNTNQAQEETQPRRRDVLDGSYGSKDVVAEDAGEDEDNEEGFEDAYCPFDYDEHAALTEQDLYDHLLKDSMPFSTPLMKALLRQAFQKEQRNDTESGGSTTDIFGEVTKPGVTSTLTTTERTTLPDGTVHTKMVLKKRFADGREESAETTHTTHGQQEQQSRQLLESEAETLKTKKYSEAEKPQEENKNGKDKKKTGWFWN